MLHADLCHTCGGLQALELSPSCSGDTMLMSSAEIGSEHPGSLRGSLGPEKLAQRLTVFKNQEAHRFWTIYLKTHPCFWAKRVSA